MSDVEDLIAWLRAQLDGDERTANAASQALVEGSFGSDYWDQRRAEMLHWESSPWLFNKRVTVAGLADYYRPQDRPSIASGRAEVTDHIALHDPAAVLADVEAKRKLVEAVERYLDPHPGQSCTNEDDEYDSCDLHVAAMIQTVDPYALRLLALAYAHRPGYREEWRPT